MRYRQLAPYLTQSDLEYAQAHWRKFDRLIDLCGVGTLPLPGVSTSLAHDNTPTISDIRAWIENASALISGQKLLVFCGDGQHQSSTVCALLQTIRDVRPFRMVINEYHKKFLLEEPPHDWFPYAHWDQAIIEYLKKYCPALAITQEQKEQTSQYPLTLIDYDFSDFKRLLSDLCENGWSRPQYLASLYAYVKKLPSPALIIEIGTNEGCSAIVMGHAMRQTYSHLITIDPALKIEGASVIGDETQPAFTHAVNLFDIQRYIAEQKLEGYITLIPDYSWNVLQRWDGRPIDMLFVDGEHTYNAVLKDCEWMQWVKPGGIAVFDDWIEGVSRAVKKYIRNKPEWEIMYESSQQAHDHYFITQLRKRKI